MCKNEKLYVNEIWGMKLIDEVRPIECTERVVWCNGGDQYLGHPKVYINLDKSDGAYLWILCYVKKDDHQH